MIQYGRKFVYGIQLAKPIVGAPEGIRTMGLMYGLMILKIGKRKYAIEDFGEEWRAVEIDRGRSRPQSIYLK